MNLTCPVEYTTRDGHMAYNNYCEVSFQFHFGLCFDPDFQQSQWSNYSIIYEGAVKYSEPRKFFEVPQISHFGEQKACNDSAGVEVAQQRQLQNAAVHTKTFPQSLLLEYAQADQPSRFFRTVPVWDTLSRNPERCLCGTELNSHNQLHCFV